MIIPIRPPRGESDRDCAVAGCSRHGAFRPTILIWAVGYPPRSHPPMRMQIGMPICEDHRATISAADLMTEDLRRVALATAQQAGKAVPDVDRAEVEWEPIGRRWPT